MANAKITDYVRKSELLTADQVKSLPVGAMVALHSFDRRGAHIVTYLTVAQSGKSKILTGKDFYALRIEKRIRKETDRFCYTKLGG